MDVERVIGALLLTGSGLWLGLQVSRDLTRRLAALESWSHALTLLEQELSFHLPDLPHLVDTLASRCEGGAGEFLEVLRGELSGLAECSFAEIWTKTLKRRPGGLTEKDREPLYRLGGILGRCGWEEQCEAAGLTRRAVERQAEELRKELHRKGQSSGILGLSLGAFAAILLL